MSFVFPSKCRPLSQNILWQFLGMGGWGKGDSRCKYRLLCCTSCNLPEKVFLFVCLIQQRTNPSLLIQDNHYHAVVDSQNHIFHLILEHTGKKKRKKIICKLQKFSVDKKKVCISSKFIQSGYLPQVFKQLVGIIRLILSCS